MSNLNVPLCHCIAGVRAVGALREESILRGCAREAPAKLLSQPEWRRSTVVLREGPRGGVRYLVCTMYATHFIQYLGGRTKYVCVVTLWCVGRVVNTCYNYNYTIFRTERVPTINYCNALVFRVDIVKNAVVIDLRGLCIISKFG